MLRNVLPTAVLALTSCAHDAKPPEAPVELSVPPIGKAPTTAATPPPKNEMCHAIVMASAIEKSSFGCVIDEQISKHQGILTFPCVGNGDAEAAFGEQVYSGRIQDGELDLEVKTELEWPGDGCRWGTTANIKGPVTSDPRSRLAWTYKDYVVRGTTCSGSCTAKSAFTVRLQKNTKPRDDDDDDDR